MASPSDAPPRDALTLLRRSIANKTLPVPSTEPHPPAGQTDVSLAEASYLIFACDSAGDGAQHVPVPLTQHTRFISQQAGNQPIDLRSVYFAWLKRDLHVGQYLADIGRLNGELERAGKSEHVSNLVFEERMDLTTWLSGDVGESDSDFIRSLDADQAPSRARTADALKQAPHDVEMRDAGGDDGQRPGEEQQRLRDIYAAERRMGDHNTVLRGVKIQDFGKLRQYSPLFLGKVKAAPGQPAPAPALASQPALRPPVKPTQSGRRPEPIILLSSSFSSLLKMQNIKSFLAEGVYTPLESSGEAANILHITRQLRTVNPGHTTRFILVDDPSNFRPDYWDRVVAVFTTGQTWQFKSYKWTNPAHLFNHALGVYVGWKGEVTPDTVKGWGRQVLSVQIDKGSNRWRDREVVEDIWSQIELRMRAKGWGKDAR